MALLERLGADYFHQDYDLMGSSPLDVVRKFVRDLDSAAVVNLRNEIDGALASKDEAELRTFWVDTCDSHFEPDRAGMTNRAWFEQMRAELSE